MLRIPLLFESLLFESPLLPDFYNTLQANDD